MTERIKTPHGYTVIIDNMRITTSNIFPPIPTRKFDWCATFEDYEPGGPQGFGPTEQDAIDDLMQIWRADNSQFGVGA